MDSQLRRENSGKVALPGTGLWVFLDSLCHFGYSGRFKMILNRSEMLQNMSHSSESPGTSGTVPLAFDLIIER